jgi:hypothetical protein
VGNFDISGFYKTLSAFIPWFAVNIKSVVHIDIEWDEWFSVSPGVFPEKIVEHAFPAAA